MTTSPATGAGLSAPHPMAGAKPSSTAMVAGATSHSAADPWEVAAEKATADRGDAEVDFMTTARGDAWGDFMGPLRGWQAFTYEASCLDAVAYHLRALVSDGSAAFQELEGRLNRGGRPPSPTPVPLREDSAT